MFLVKMLSYLITHTDIDGVAAAALYTYLTRGSYNIIFAEPHDLHKVLYKVYRKRPKLVAIFDLGLNANHVDFVAGVVELLSSKNSNVIWFDHHVWNDEWINRIVESGAKLFVDRSTCATGVVAKYVSGEESVDKEFIDELVAGVCGADLWRFDHSLSPFFMRLVRRGDSNDWRLYVYNVISKGVLWCDDFEKKVVERIEEEIKELSKDMRIRVFEANGVRVGIALKNQRVENSILASRVMSISNADIVAIVDRSGKISLRSRGFDVRSIAVALGGGGHRAAAGAKIDIPLHVKLLSIFNENAILEYVENIIKSHI